MSKRLIMILVLAFLVGLSFAAYAEVQNVKVSGDLTFIGASRQLSITDVTSGTSVDPRKRSNFLATIARVRIDADLTDNVMATVRLLNERYWGQDSGSTDNVDATSVNTDVDIDLAYATLKEFLYSPLTLTVGRQELHFGNDMIVGDVDTNRLASTASAFSSKNPDLSARKSFDAIRATLNYDPLVVDVFGAKVREKALNQRDDSNLFGVYATYAVDKKTSVQPYWFLRQRQGEDTSVSNGSKEDTTHVLGVLVKSMPVENLTISAEGAVQLGQATIYPYSADPISGKTVKRQAYAVQLGVNYAMPKVKYTPTIAGIYSYFSGQKEDQSKRVRAWDPMYENQTSGNIVNALIAQTNAHIGGGIVTLKPKEDITLKGEYYAYWWDKKYRDGETIYDTYSNSLKTTDRKFVGQELDITATYDYTEDVQFSLLGGTFFPGSAWAKPNRRIANEVIGSMKVTF